MQVTVTFRHMEASQALRGLIDTKISHLKKYLIRPTEIHVIMSVEKFRHKCEIVLFEQNFKASAAEVTDDMYKSLDKAISKIQAQVSKHKKIIQEHHKHHQSLGEVTTAAEEVYERTSQRKPI